MNPRTFSKREDLPGGTHIHQIVGTHTYHIILLTLLLTAKRIEKAEEKKKKYLMRQAAAHCTEPGYDNKTFGCSIFQETP